VIVEPAPAKLNLALHVRRRRPDGYHDIETLFAFCADGDVVRAEEGEELFAIAGPFAGALAGQGDNLVTRAAAAFRSTFRIAAAHAIRLEKNLPVASGIGGGSADAAATLRALARLHGVALGDPRLNAIAADLGADVPACLAGMTAFGSGRGDALSAVAGVAGTPVLLVNPGVAVSTAAVFAAWDGIDRGPLDPGAWREGRNDLALPARTLTPVIGDVLAALAAQPRVTLARMSGSGATCFALFEDAAARDAAAAALAPRGWWRLATTLT
jgi:4-diphosphocytidyl-2-C-methyl-D-erythritol kinase